jgi:hypothetical protein
MLIPSVMRDCVCFVYAKMKGELRPVGTAFFMALPFGQMQAVIVVTALHVVAKIQQESDDAKTFLRVNTKDGGFRIVEVDTTAWVKPDHVEEIVDVCFCPWPFPWQSSDYDIRFVSREQAATSDVMATEELGVGNEVAFAGLFVNHYGTQRNEPIVRFGNLSAIPAELVRTRYGDIEAYLVESRSVGGLSGSPVLVDVGLFRGADRDVREYRRGGPGMYLIGIMHGHWAAPVEEAKVDDGITEEYVNMGIAVVTPIDKLLNLIDQSRWGRALLAATEKLSDQELKGSVVVQVPLDPNADSEVVVLPLDPKGN